MKNKELNLVEILKDCPEGTPLYSPICGTVILDSVKDDYIYTYTADKGATVTFFSDGKYMPCPDAECQLFPAKDNRDWESFHICPNFKKGDFVTRIYDNGEHCILLMGDTDWSSPKNHVNFICYVDLGDGAFEVSESHEYWCFVEDFNTCKKFRFSTDEEKKKLLIAIINNGYIWDSEKNELFKIEETLELNYEFKPFDKVLVRDEDDEEWLATLFSHEKKGASYPYVCINDRHSQCIPYKGNEHLVGTIESIEID